MALEPGGRADKLGNEFERHWGALQLLRVLAGEAISVFPEGLGPDEKGVDMWVVRADGKRVGHQCKRDNGTVSKWSVADLVNEGILANAKYQLGRSENHRFAFVSSDPAPILTDLCERTSRCDGDPDKYAEYLASTSGKHRDGYSRIAGVLGVDAGTPGGRAPILTFLARLEVLSFDRGRKAEEEVRARARLVVDGDPDCVVANLGQLVVRRLGNEIHADEIRSFLRDQGFEPRNLGAHPELCTSIERLQNLFRRSCLLIDETLIPRPEAEDLLEKVMSADGPSVICVHGKAGDGKSGVLHEFSEKLKADGIPYLPICLDIHRPAKNPTQFGKEVCSLPSSPAACLRAVAGGRTAVLILDQLDAIRWTAAHSSEAWGVCAEIIAEALMPHARGRTRVVVACRTFDMNDDPRLRTWKKQESVEEFEVGLLGEAQARDVVEGHGQDWRVLTKGQRALLRSPQSLYLWSSLADGDNPLGFRTETGLMQAYWEDVWERRIPQRTVSRDECSQLLEAVVGYMDSRGVLLAPGVLVGHRVSARNALESVGILACAGEKLRFRHQSFVDYLIAERIFRDSLAGGNGVVDWLRATRQSLFRRNQLRQVLRLLRDQDDQLYMRTVREILSSGALRFHLKHLVLNFLGYCDQPTKAETELTLQLLGQPEWRDHTVEQVLWDKAGWFEVLVRRGILQAWLASHDDTEMDRGLSLAMIIAPREGDLVAQVLRPYERLPDPWPARVSRVLGMARCEDEAVSLFALRVRQLRRRAPACRHILWERLGKQNPRRALTLFRASVSSLVDVYGELSTGAPPHDLPKLPGIGGHDIPHIQSAARGCHHRAWFSLTRAVTRRREIIEAAMAKHHPFYAHGPTRMHGDLHLDGAVTAVNLVLQAAGGAFVREEPGRFFRQARLAFEQVPRQLRTAILEPLAAAGDELADPVLSWCCEHDCSWDLGRASSRLPWGALRRVVLRFSPVCSPGVLTRLETAILRYRDPRLRASMEWKAEHAGGSSCIPNVFGLAQRDLLSAVPRERLSPGSLDVLGQVERKFGKYHPECLRPGASASSVGSPIPRKKLGLVTDEQWLTIIDRDWSTRSHEWRESETGGYVEVSHEFFSADFGHMARRQPARFLRLALRIPGKANPCYLRAVVQAMRQTGPPEELKKLGITWHPPTAAEIEALLDQMGYSESREDAQGYCDLIRTRADAEWSETALRRVGKYGTDHPDPAASDYSCYRDGPDNTKIPEVENSSLNCVRGCAARAIRAVLFEDPKRLGLFRPAIECLVNDPSPPVRLAALSVCLPILNIDRDLAVELFLRASDMSDDRILEGHPASSFIRYARRTHLAQLTSVIERMAASEVREVADIGTQWVTAIWLHEGRMAEAANRCVAGTAAQREAAAKVASQCCEDRRLVGNCIALLQTFFEDENREVRQQAASVFRSESSLYIPEVVSLSRAFAASRAFEDCSGELVTALQWFPGEIGPYTETILDVCDKFSAPLAKESRDASQHVMHDVKGLSKLLLRLYESSQRTGQDDLQTRCLDAWDKMIESRVGGLWGVLGAIDA